MLEVLLSGGWLMVPIVICSVLSLAISLERAISLRTCNVTPTDLMSSVWLWVKSDQMTTERMQEMKSSSPLGAIIIAGLNSASLSRERMQESIQEAAAIVVHDLERNLTALGTIAAITPLLGLLGTVIGMIKVFTAIMLEGSGDTSVLAGGISEALITTAAGMCVAIPTLIFHRYFHRKIDSLVIEMEQQAVRLVDSIHGDEDAKSF
ncbi:MAG: motA/TolQ/ExbB proton channel family protein [Osedax symbiont Rs1]|nr:MAG: motA/TolQ/ExbB proton channel family protein [Osedax symbiont Rs1]